MSEAKKNRKAQVWLVCRTEPMKFLLLQTTPERGSFWQPVTGKVEKGEDVATGALRELEEETGVKVERLQEIGYEFEFEGKWGPAIETCFWGEVDSEVAIKTDPKEHVGYQWLPLREAIELMGFETNREALVKLVSKLRQSS